MSEKCNEQVYREGGIVAVMDIPPEKAEDLCKQLSVTTEYLHDWYYSAGRVIVKAIKHSEINKD